MKAKQPKLKPGGEEIPSPCTGACRMEDGVCVGCYRTLDEIVGWISAGNDEKRAILAAAEKRRRLAADEGLRSEGGDR